MKAITIKKPEEGFSWKNNNVRKETDKEDKIEMKYSYKSPWVIGKVATIAGPILKVDTNLKISDTIGSWKARWGIGRMKYSINPGIYSVGDADSNSPVLVTANYKMSFDALRKELSGLNAWILVLDTKGINVWCAAGKGTFGTKELVNRIKKVKLQLIVSHKNIILPQLGAPGITAHEVQRLSGFKVTFGPVRAEDIRAFLQNGMKAESEMRTVKFTLKDRLVLTPVELVSALKPTLILFGILFILNSIGFSHFGFVDLYAFIGAILAGAVVTPVLLPWIPGRAFAFKGFITGFAWSLLVNIINGWTSAPNYGILISIAYLLILPSVSAYLAINFTGCSTYTSPSGVLREMKIALPLIGISVGLGIIALIFDSLHFLKLF